MSKNKMLSAVKSAKNDGFYTQYFDHFTRYLDATGNTVAQYTYDAFGNIISESGHLSEFFHYRFSTKYYDAVSELYYYGYRFYNPALMRWLNLDPIEEEGGENLYAFCANDSVSKYDKDGCAYFAYRPLDIPIIKHLGITLNFDWMNKDNVAVLHEQLFFEDGGIPTNQGYFEDNQVRIDMAGIQYKTPHSTGWNDCIMRKAVRAVRPRPYSLLGDDEKGIAKYNCQDWAEEVRIAYWTIASGRVYHPWGYTEMRARP